MNKIQRLGLARMIAGSAVFGGQALDNYVSNNSNNSVYAQMDLSSPSHPGNPSGMQSSAIGLRMCGDGGDGETEDNVIDASIRKLPLKYRVPVVLAIAGVWGGIINYAFYKVINKKENKY